ncbi:MAG TPA: NAD(P)/FAD-dependent oxidoreductase [Bacteroidales bacterium]
MEKYDIIVIGGGAAGLLAAGRAAELGAKVLIIEKMERPGRKLLITGKGRCNITNIAPIEAFLEHIYPNPDFVRQAFNVFFASDIIDLLNKFGVPTVIERGGRVFPKSNSARDVVDALVKYVKRYNVQIIQGARVTQVNTANKKATGIDYIHSNQTKTVISDRVILCTGGCLYPATGSSGDGYKIAGELGHTIVKPLPSLVALEVSDKNVKELEGLNLRNVTATVLLNNKKQQSLFGEMLFETFGLDGPIILSLSRFVVEKLQNKANKISINIDLKPALDEAQLEARLLRDFNTLGRKPIGIAFKELLPQQLISFFINRLGIEPFKPCSQISAKERQAIIHLLKNFEFEITGYRPFTEAIITAGGISTKEIDPKTMQSKLIENLYFAGEIIDLDADTGGYNLQIAWSTAILAATSATQQKNE